MNPDKAHRLSVEVDSVAYCLLLMLTTSVSTSHWVLPIAYRLLLTILLWYFIHNAFKDTPLNRAHWHLIFNNHTNNTFVTDGLISDSIDSMNGSTIE